MYMDWGQENAAAKQGRDAPVRWDSSRVVNGHMLICGMSGAGKTYTLRRLVESIIATSGGRPPRFHIFDVHGDIAIPGASTVQFSEVTDYGLNPLRISADPHYGGVRKCIQAFMYTLNKVMHALGPKQEAALRNILYDVCELNGFKSDDPSTWLVDETHEATIPSGRLYLDVPFGDKNEAKAFGATWDGVLRHWWCAPEQYVGGLSKWPPKQPVRRHPSIRDAKVLAKHILLQRFLGTNQPAVAALESVNKAAQGYQRKLLQALRRGENGRIDESDEAELNKAREKAVAAYEDYASKIMSGRELDDVLKYDSTDVLKSVIDRLDNLDAIGVFKPEKPPFDDATPVWRYHIKALGSVEQKLFVLFRLKQIFEQAVQEGESDVIRQVLILDEAHLYADGDDDNIINTIAKEGRKFGIGAILASQSPTHFTEDFIASVATKVILGIDEMYWRGAASKMRLGEDALAWVKLKQTILVQMKMSGSTRNEWKWTVLQK